MTHLLEGWTLEGRTFTGPPSRKAPDGVVSQAYSDELEDKLIEIYDVLAAKKTVAVILADMYEINERFQALTEWLKARGMKQDQRYEQGVFMKCGGVLYFVGHDTNQGRYIRGVEKTIDLQPWAEELVRQVGLEARLRRAGAIT